MLCFSRDSEILKQLPNQPAFMQVGLKGRPNTTENTLVFPPSGVIPFHGFTMYGTTLGSIFDIHRVKINRRKALLESL